MDYTVKLWDSKTGRMILILETSDIMQAEREVLDGRRRGDMVFIYDKEGRSVRIPWGV